MTPKNLCLLAAVLLGAARVEASLDATYLDMAEATNWSAANLPSIGILGPTQLQAGSSADYEFQLDGVDIRHFAFLPLAWSVYLDDQLLGVGAAEWFPETVNNNLVMTVPFATSLTFPEAGSRQLNFEIHGSEILRVYRVVDLWNDALNAWESEHWVVDHARPFSVQSTLTVQVSAAPPVPDDTPAGVLLVGVLATLLPLARRHAKIHRVRA